MKKEILDRYARTEAGAVIIDISTGNVEELYNEYDWYAPYVKKELDADLAEYITESVEEIGSTPFVIRFHIHAPLKAELTSRLQRSVSNYFRYLRELEIRDFRKMVRRSFYLFLIGLAFITASIWINTLYENSMGVLQKVFAEGLTVAGWVSLWEAVALFLIDWMPHRKKIRMYARIAASRLEFMESQ
jgi:hypothetical protein